nr:hypothetical protein L204_05551 [Cryptococcus depauperatus CBS 7855]
MNQMVIDPSLERSLVQDDISTSQHHSLQQITQRRTKTGRPSKAKGTVPGSAADFRRREANRLAADRSRSRQAEKAAGLEHTARALAEENARLKEQIAALENALEEYHPEIQSNQRQEEGRPTSIPPRNGESPQETQQSVEDGQIQTHEQEAHSHTILAALTDITGVDFSEGNESNWMHGMESFLKETGESGRLGELAAVATGHEGEHMPLQHPERPELNANAPFKQYASSNSTSTPETNAAIIIAAALNTEVERVLMEDLALTKAAVVKVERQISFVGSENVNDEAAESTAASLLPNSIFSDEIEVLQSLFSEYQETISRLESELFPLRDNLVKTRDEKTAIEKKIVQLVKEIRSLGVNGEEEKEKTLVSLKSIGGFVETLLNEEHPDNQYVTGTFSSPALTRRRRGRPPKSDVARTIYHNFIINHSQEPEYKAKRKMPKKLLKSRLQQATAEDESESMNGQVSGPSYDSQPKTLNAICEDDQEATAEAVARAEAFILSHLNPPQSQGHGHGEHGEGERDARLESTSFADFLPAQEELERQTEESATHHSTEGTPAEHLQSINDDQLENPISVLSRLKQGPPGSCDICMRTETTVWRKLTLGGIDHKVCNACGLYHAKFGVIRPPELWGDGKSLKKRRPGASTRQEPGEAEELGIPLAKRIKRSVLARNLAEMDTLEGRRIASNDGTLDEAEDAVRGQYASERDSVEREEAGPNSTIAQVFGV